MNEFYIRPPDKECCTLFVKYPAVLFQGEENKVILLSLVRSNRKDQIGFFGIRNRICVAISRAKCALYIFGNSSVYGTSTYWKVSIFYLFFLYIWVNELKDVVFLLRYFIVLSLVETVEICDSINHVNILGSNHWSFKRHILWLIWNFNEVLWFIEG